MEVFVFPLGHVVFYPSSSKPFDIFEPRYVQMIRDSIQLGTPIAVATVDEPWQQFGFDYGSPLSFVRPVAGYGVPMILEERTDGSILVFLQGRGKVRLGAALDKGAPYIVCEAERIEENHQLQKQAISSFMMINKILLNWLEAHISETESREQFLQTIRSAEEVIGCYTSYLIGDPDLQQLILESNDINEKIQLVSGLIASGEVA